MVARAPAAECPGAGSDPETTFVDDSRHSDMPISVRTSRRASRGRGGPMSPQWCEQPRDGPPASVLPDACTGHDGLGPDRRVVA
jgi:hypothetical protein